jgi:hypothetical protein
LLKENAPALIAHDHVVLAFRQVAAREVLLPERVADYRIVDVRECEACFCGGSNLDYTSGSIRLRYSSHAGQRAIGWVKIHKSGLRVPVM